MNYRVEGSDDAPVVVLAGSLGSTLEMWDLQVPALTGRFRVVRYDHPGHGGSPLLELRGIGTLAAAALGLLDELGVDRASWCGLSLGGAVGMRLAIDVPDRIDRLALLSTSARFAPPEIWQERADRVRTEGIEALANAVEERWLTPAFGDVSRYRTMFVTTSAEGYARCCEAIRDWDVREQVGLIGAPTLVVSGADDPSTPPEHGALLADRIPGARHVVLPHAAHLLNVERAGEVNELLVEHLTA
jgi:3-oxoadipate enol-lactonase